MSQFIFYLLTIYDTLIFMFHFEIYFNSFKKTYLFIYLFSHHMACGILFPQPGIKPVPPAVEGQSLNHWTTRDFPLKFFVCLFVCLFFEVSLTYNKLHTYKVYYLVSFKLMYTSARPSPQSR